MSKQESATCVVSVLLFSYTTKWVCVKMHLGSGAPDWPCIRETVTSSDQGPWPTNMTLKESYVCSSSFIGALIWRVQSLPYHVRVNHGTTWYHLFCPAQDVVNHCVTLPGIGGCSPAWNFSVPLLMVEDHLFMSLWPHHSECWQLL